MSMFLRNRLFYLCDKLAAGAQASYCHREGQHALYVGTHLLNIRTNILTSLIQKFVFVRDAYTEVS